MSGLGFGFGSEREKGRRGEDGVGVEYTHPCLDPTIIDDSPDLLINSFHFNQQRRTHRVLGSPGAH
jgi:hypothetical protein